MSSSSLPSHRARRGFAILIVLAVLAMAMIILATQLASVEGQQAAQIRTAEELKARDVAEHCLEVADAYVVASIGGKKDLDLVLDPNKSTTIDGDEFLPPTDLLPGGSSVVTIPLDVANQLPSGASSQFYKYRSFSIAATERGGTSGNCFIRYDDNSDDMNPLFDMLATSNSGIAEGPDAGRQEVLTRDRDRAVYTSVVAVVPRRDDAATAFRDAHARVSVRRMRAMPAGLNIGAAIEAGGTFKISNGGTICGEVAGVIADTIVAPSNNTETCVCGDVNAVSSGTVKLATSDATKCTGCSSTTLCPISTDSNTTDLVDKVITVISPDFIIPPPPAPPFPSSQPPQPYVLTKNEALGKVGSSGNNIGDANFSAAVLYFRHATAAPSGYQPAGSVDVFAWDRFDSDTSAGSGGRQLIFNGTSVSHKCSDTKLVDPLPKPCKWPTEQTGGGVSCAAGETPCWKLVARLNDANSKVVDWYGNTLESEHSLSTTVGGVTSDGFTPLSGTIPNMKSTLTTWAQLAPGCPTCTPSSPASFTNGPSTDLFIVATGKNFKIQNNDLATKPHAVVFIDAPNNATGASSVTLDGTLTYAANRTRLGVHTNAPVKFDGSDICCPSCDCSLGCVATAPPAHGAGYAIRSNEVCSLTKASETIGQVVCGAVDAMNNSCFVGGVVVSTTASATAPNKCLTDTADAPYCADQASLCADSKFTIAGNLTSYGNICFSNKAELVTSGGVIQSASNMYFKNKLTAVGQLRATENIVLGNNATVTFNGTNGTKDNQGLPSALWMEKSW